MSEPQAANEIAAGFEAQFGGVWVGHEAGVYLPDHQLIAGFGNSATGRLILTSVLLRGAPVTSDALRLVPVKDLENDANLNLRGADIRAITRGLKKLPRLVRAEARSSEEFSRLVAKHYELWSAAVPHPASAMAEANRVKLPTVHTWIREARLRGFITTGTRRKASRLGND